MQAIPANRRTNRKPRQAARCAGSEKKQAALCPAGHIADGFLKHRFLPLYHQEGLIPCKKQVERNFFKSLSQLAGCCSFLPLNVSAKPYPYNILLSYWDAQQQINDVKKDTELFIITNDRSEVMLYSKETVQTGSTLYYIPVMPLYRLLQDRRQKQCAELLLSVFAYLFRMAGVPYYRDQGSYLFHHYEIMEEWTESEMDGGDTQDYLQNRSALRIAAYYGDRMHRKIYNLYHLTHFRERIDGFVPQNRFQRDCLKIARDAFNIWEQYPKHTIYEHIPDEWEQDEEENGDYEEKIRIDEYISFISENEGSLFDSLSQMVNDEFNEMGFVQEPTVTTVYDQSDKEAESLDFERRLLDMITDLCTLLNELQ